MILLLGATGLLGHNVLVKLLDAGHRVVALVRNADAISDKVSDPLLTVKRGSLLDIETLRDAMRDCDAVINCAGTTDMSLLHYEDYLPVNRNICESILQIMDETGVTTLVHVSSANTVGYGTANNPGTEEMEMKSPFAQSFYARSKREGEQILDWYAMEHPQSHIIVLNPGFMVGPYDAKPSSGKLLLAAYNHKWMAAPSGGKSFVHVDDVAHAVVNALTKGCNGGHYLLTGQDMSLRDFYALQAEVCGYSQRLFTIPDVVVHLAGRVGDLLRSVGIRTQLSSRNVRQLLVMEYYSNARAVAELDMPQTSIRKAISDFFAWYNESQKNSIFAN